jgi:hypothetical protein
LSSKYDSHFTGQSISNAGSSGRQLRSLSHVRTTSPTSGVVRIDGTARSWAADVGSMSTAASIGTISTLHCCRNRWQACQSASRSCGRTAGSSQPPG